MADQHHNQILQTQILLGRLSKILLSNAESCCFNSIVSDTNVWEAMKKNMEVLDYVESSETNKSNLNDSTTVTGGEIIPTDGSSGAEDGPISLTQTMKPRVLTIVRILSEFYQNIFGNLATEEGSSSGNTPA